MCFCSGRIRTLVAMATYNSHSLIMGKGKLTNFLSQWGYLEKYTELFIDYNLLYFIGLLSKALNLIGCRVAIRVNFRKNVKILLLRNHKVDKAHTLHTCV